MNKESTWGRTLNNWGKLQTGGVDFWRGYIYKYSFYIQKLYTIAVSEKGGLNLKESEKGYIEEVQ